MVCLARPRQDVGAFVRRPAWHQHVRRHPLRRARPGDADHGSRTGASSPTTSTSPHRCAKTTSPASSARSKTSTRAADRAGAYRSCHAPPCVDGSQPTTNPAQRRRSSSRAARAQYPFRPALALPSTGPERKSRAGSEQARRLGSALIGSRGAHASVRGRPACSPGRPRAPQSSALGKRSALRSPKGVGEGSAGEDQGTLLKALCPWPSDR